MERSEVEIQWYSGTGKGGQHRNKHQNCCRLIHLPTGLAAKGSGSRERTRNFDAAWRALVSKVAALAHVPAERRFSDVVVRTYHFERGQVTDHSTGRTAPIRPVMEGALEAFTLDPERGTSQRKTARV